jgi:hypothetical protein
MKPYQANLFNATLLVILGLWSYSASGRDTHTLIVPALGILLSFFHKPFKAENKTVAHVVVVLTFLILSVLFLPLRNSINAGNNMAILRVVLMIVSCTAAMIVYIRSFIEARKNRLSEEM